MTPAARMRLVEAVAATGYAMTAKSCAPTMSTAGGMLADGAIAWGIGVGGGLFLLAVWVLAMAVPRVAQ